jgi:formylglycine-generating enzyme required for sulfatase activity
MKRMMLATLAGLAAFAVNADLSHATVTSVTQNPENGLVMLSYTLTGTEDVIVTPEVLTNGVAVSAAESTGWFGDMNRLLSPGAHTAYWQPRVFWPGREFAADELAVRLTCWSKANPPDYMAVDIKVKERVRFYTCAEAVPYGVSNAVYKTDILLMRKIHAAGREAVLGTAMTGSATEPWGFGSTEAGSNAKYEFLPHNVVFTNDFYLGVYEFTCAQYFNAFGRYSPWFSRGTNVNGAVDVDFALKPIGSFRMREERQDDSMYWPEFGHEVPPSTRIGKLRTQTGVEIDFPTEAQWEFAAREGGRVRIPENLDEIAWYRDNAAMAPSQVFTSGGAICPQTVGLKKPNGLGLYDIYGNVSEIMLDCSGLKYYEQEDFFRGADSVEPVGPAYGTNMARRVSRGASITANAEDLRPGYRRDHSPDNAFHDVGMRLCAPGYLK